MTTKQLLQSIITALGSQRRTGSTTVMLDGVKGKNGVVIVVANHRQAEDIGREGCKLGIADTNLISTPEELEERLMGRQSPVVIDLHAVVTLLCSALNSIEFQEQRVMKIKRELKSMMETIERI